MNAAEALSGESLRSILVEIDGSQTSEARLERAVELARRCNARLTLLCVVPQVPMSAYAVPELLLRLRDDAELHAREILRDAREQVPLDLPVTTVLKTGCRRTAISGETRRGNHDLVLAARRYPAPRIRRSAVPAYA
jgi:hypothetical protein